MLFDIRKEIKTITPLVMASAALIVLAIVAYGSQVTWGNLLIGLVIGTGFSFLNITRQNEQTTDEKPLPFVTAAVVALLVLGSLVSGASWMNADFLKNQITVETSDPKALPALVMAQPKIVTQAMAMQMASRKLSEDAGMGSQFALETMNVQLWKGRQVWVGFLEPRSGFVQLRTEAAPGYVVVDAADPSRVELVKTPITVYPDGWFAGNLERRLQLAGYWTTLVDGYRMVIDEAGHPYFVIPKLERKLSLGLNHSDAPVGVIVVDAETRKVTEYSLNNAPAWLDRSISVERIGSQLGNHYHLINGWFNPGDKGRLEINSTDVVFQDGRAYGYFSLTSVGADKGIVGFVLADLRTGKSRFVKLAGTQEGIAEGIVEGSVKEKQYQATNAIPYLIENEPTYVMGLTDAQGILRGYGLVSIRNQQYYGVGDTYEAALRNYVSSMSVSKVAELKSSAKTLTVKGVISRVGQEVVKGETRYVLMVEGDTHLYVAISLGNPYLTVARVGDKIQLDVLDSGEPVLSITKFETIK